MFKNGKRKAFLLYHLLPVNVREKLHFYLTLSEWESLYRKNGEKQVAENIKPEEKISLYKEIVQNINQYSTRRGSVAFSAFYFILHISLFVIFLPHNMDSLKSVANSEISSVIFLFYAFFGSYIIYNRSAIYWRLVFHLLPVRFITLIMAAFVFIFIILMVGSLNTDIAGEGIALEYFLLAVFLGPLFEEIFFRDFLYRAFYLLESRVSILSILIPSVLFSLVHLTGFYPWEFLVYFLSGVFLALLRWQSAGIIYPIIVHSASNLFFLYL